MGTGYSIFYSDRKTAIEPMTGLRDLKPTAQSVRKHERKLPSALFMRDVNFLNLYEYWIRYCVDYMWFSKNRQMPAPPEEHLRCKKLFLEGTEEETRAFLDEYIRCLSTRGLLDTGLTGEEGRKLREGIDTQLCGVPAHIRLRYIAVCVFVNLPPEQLLEEGSQWTNWVSGGDEDEVLSVKDGTAFFLNAAGDSETVRVSKTLKNKSQTPCTIFLTYDKTQYSVKLPPQGILRAVFADTACRTISCLKGTVSCDDSTSAVIQRGTQDGAVLVDVTDSYITEYPPLGSFTDASADEDGGFLLLTPRKIYSNIRDVPLKKSPLPIRCFRAGNQWARLYADGRLECDLGRGEELTLSEVTAVVEDGERGLLLYKQDGAWDYRLNERKKIPPEEFYWLMMRRFAEPDCCETVETQFMRMIIHQNGKPEVILK